MIRSIYTVLIFLIVPFCLKAQGFYETIGKNDAINQLLSFNINSVDSVFNTNINSLLRMFDISISKNEINLLNYNSLITNKNHQIVIIDNEKVKEYDFLTAVSLLSGLSFSYSCYMPYQISLVQLLEIIFWYNLNKCDIKLYQLRDAYFSLILFSNYNYVIDEQFVNKYNERIETYRKGFIQPVLFKR